MNEHGDTIVIGGGMVGAALAWGLARLGVRVIMLDGADQAERAARANFGLVWGQSKGDGMPEYARWTRTAISLWPEFEDELLNETGVFCAFQGNGGLHLCMSEQELEDRRALFERMSRIGPEHLDLKILDHQETAELAPGLGPDVLGAGFCAQDGHVSPHALLAAMQRAILLRGGKVVSDRQVDGIAREGGNWVVTSRERRFEAPNLVLAAGTANRALGRMLGIDIPVFGLKGQILVTERAAPRLRLATHKVRQTEAGTMLLGDSKEPEAGADDRSTAFAIHDIAERCVKMFPWLGGMNLVRAWGGIRTMTQDGFPIYDRFPDLPGLFAANCHSGVTLAPIHALRLAPMIAEGRQSQQLEAMSARRFNV